MPHCDCLLLNILAGHLKWLFETMSVPAVNSEKMNPGYDTESSLFYTNTGVFEPVFWPFSIFSDLGLIYILCQRFSSSLFYHIVAKGNTQNYQCPLTTPTVL